MKKLVVLGLLMVAGLAYAADNGGYLPSGSVQSFSAPIHSQVTATVGTIVKSTGIALGVAQYIVNNGTSTVYATYGTQYSVLITTTTGTPIYGKSSSNDTTFTGDIYYAEEPNGLTSDIRIMQFRAK